MKRIISVVLTLVTVLSLSACQSAAVKESAANTGIKALEKELVKVNTAGEEKACRQQMAGGIRDKRRGGPHSCGCRDSCAGSAAIIGCVVCASRFYFG